MKNMRRRIASVTLTGVAVTGLTFGGVTMTAGSVSAQEQTSAHTLLPTGKKEREFVKRVHEAHIQTKLTDKQLDQLGRELKFMNEEADTYSGGWTATDLATEIKDDSLEINSLEAAQIVHIWWDVY